jgi:hypothetical protein
LALENGKGGGGKIGKRQKLEKQNNNNSFDGGGGQGEGEDGDEEIRMIGMLNMVGNNPLMGIGPSTSNSSPRGGERLREIVLRCFKKISGNSFPPSSFLAEFCL